MPASLPLSPFVRNTLLALLLASTLAACGPKDDEFAPACPGLALVPDAGDLVRFNGQGQDVTNLVLQARIDAVPAACEPGDKGFVRATLHVVANVTQGVAGAGDPAPIGYFVALMRGDRVLEEQDFSLTPSFPPNVNRTSVRGDDIELLLPVTKKRSAAVYRIFVGFRLSRAELAYNQAHPRP